MLVRSIGWNENKFDKMLKHFQSGKFSSGDFKKTFFNRFFYFHGKRYYLSDTFTFQYSKNVVLSLNPYCYLLHHLRLLSWEKLPDPHGLSQGSKENSPE